MTGLSPERGPPRSVAIVVPCFNAERTIGETLESCLRQGHDGLDIVVVDDGSTDTTLEMVRKYEPVVRVFSGPNQGVSAARNRGISETTAEWILFVDSDDLLLPDTLKLRLEAAATADVVVCDWQDLCDSTGSTVLGPVRSVDMALLRSDAEIACVSSFWAPPAALMYRRGLVDRIGGFRVDLPIIQDARFLFDAAHLGAKFSHSAHLGAQYRIHELSLSRRHPARFARDLLTNGKQVEALWRSRGSLSAEQKAVLAVIFDHSARGLFADASPEYFEAVAHHSNLGGPLPLHARIAAPLARTIGLGPARHVLSLVGR